MRNRYLNLTCIALCFSFVCTAQNTNQLTFIENQGQWKTEVNHRVAVHGGTVYLETDAFTHTRFSSDDFELHHEVKHEDQLAAQDVIMHGHAWRTEFIGSNDQSTALGQQERQEYYNFFLGNDPSKWAGNVSAFNSVYYVDFYDGIDMAVYSKDGAFKYDMIVAPGVSPDQIKWKYNGLDHFSLEDGNLKLQTSVGVFLEMEPYAYQDLNGNKVKVACQYAINNGEVSFSFPDGYDESATLIIDPILVGASLSGTVGTENYGHCATYDDAGNIYTGAICFGLGYPTTIGAFQTTFGAGGTDISLSCLSSDATTLLYATYLGGNSFDYPHSMIVSPAGELHVFGTTGSPDFPTTAGALSSTLGGFNDITVTHFNATGAGIIGSTYVGGSAGDGSNSLSWNYGDTYRGEIILDAAGNICIASCTESSDFPVTAGAYQTTYGGGTQDAVLFSLNPTCTAMNWSTYAGGTGHEVGFGLRMEGGYVYMCGGTDNQFFAATGVQTTYGGGTGDGYVLRFNNTGSAVSASTYWGFLEQDFAFFLDIDGDGDVYIYGQSANGLLPISPGVYANANSNQFIAKMNEDLSAVEFSTQIGSGMGGAFGYDFIPIAFMVDNCKFIYFSGHSATAGLTTSPTAFQTTGGFYLGVLDPGAVSLSFATYYGGPGGHVDGGTSRFDPDGVVYQAACTFSGFNTTPGAWSSTYPAGYDVGVFKMDFEAQGTNAIAGAVPNTSGCAPFTVNFLNTGSGNTFIWDFDDNGATSTQFEPTYTFNNPGVYDVMLVAIDSSTCNIADTNYLTITVNAAPIVDLGNDTTICTGAVLLDAGNAGATYVWQDNSTNQTFNATSSGTYWVEVDAGGCTVSDTVNIIIGNPVVDLGPDIQTCTPSLTLDAGNNGSTYLWQDNSTNQTFDVTAVGTYWVEVDAGGCTASDTIEITAGSITTSLPNDTLMCAGSALVLDAGNPGATYLWQDNSTNQTFNVTQAGTYFVDVTLGICNATDTVNVDYFSPNAYFSVIDTTGCTDFFTSFTDLSSTPESTITNWFWDFGDSFTSSDQNAMHQYGASGNYNVTLTVTTANGCQNTYSRNVQIILYPEPLAMFNFTPLDPEPGDQMNFQDQSTNATSWLWDFNGETTSTQQNPAHTFDGTGTFTVTLHIESAEGCQDSIQMYLDIREELIFYVPNAFTPDGDEFNNVWQPIFTSGFDASDYHLLIFNRWGEVVFESYNHEVGWDGTYGGKLVADNVFTWVIEFGDINNDERHTVNGHLTILR
ncbi:MAG: hypothetical protein DCO96_15710 [Fluviicola sp. XM-24bin1]|nr:MAG: hypothetical protein DCO96_15710 [Fluviicola sp. XM-24bin1]